MTEITVIGLGKMGRALASTLLGSGLSVTIWNRSADNCEEFLSKGATLAPSLAAAIDASNTSLFCVRDHVVTNDLLASTPCDLGGKTVIDLSTGGVSDAQALAGHILDRGGHWMIGMINAYPSAIGDRSTSILCASRRETWDKHARILHLLGGSSAHVGTAPAAIPGLFAAMFAARQGLMFGLIYGGAVCKRSGLDLSVFADQMPVTLTMAENYANLFVRTVPESKFDNADATMLVYEHALQEILATFEATGTRSDFPRLMRDVTAAGVQSGLGDKELTALVEHLAAN